MTHGGITACGWDLDRAILRGDPRDVAAMAATADAEALGEGLRSVVSHASLTVRRMTARTDAEQADRIAELRAMAATLMACDAPIIALREVEDEEVEGCARFVEPIAAAVPAAGVVTWTWAVAFAPKRPWMPTVVALADRAPPGLEDGATRAWASRVAARQIHAAWSMRLLAACGAAA